MFPARLHDTRQTTSGNFPVDAGAAEVDAEEGSSVVLTQGAVSESFVQMITVLSLEILKQTR